MQEKQHYKWGIRKQLVIFTTTLAIITYTTSGFFIYILYPIVKDFIGIGEMTFTIITFLLGIIWSGILAFFAAVIIINPLRKLEKVAIKAASGDISEKVDIPKVDNEIRSLAVAFNEMLVKLREMVHNIDQNFQQTNETVLSISNESTAAAKQASAIARTTSEIAAGAENSASAIQATTESVEGVIEIAQRVEQKAKVSESISCKMVKDLGHAKTVVQSLITGIETLSNDNQQSLMTVKELEENAAKIEQVIQLVGEIAGQTNLLALNASIEAARAGEHGKGFAVVAEEVRLLADESAKAVQGISHLTKNIQQGVNRVVVQIKQQVDTANEEVSKGTKTNAALEEMTASIHKMANATAEISDLVKDQMHGIKALSTQSEEVASIAEETSAGAQEVSALIQYQTDVIESVEKLTIHLREQAESLQGTITQFKV
ncbi:methyl-accepting chemotaxis protein [Niallia sp. Krafla_26]|uniref:methyl-accepting chemotaxis protein n=1 Tax=Niallia sp. Krafla_26 TaxID=3064703 RepID=UPI003D17ACAF